MLLRFGWICAWAALLSGFRFLHFTWTQCLWQIFKLYIWNNFLLVSEKHSRWWMFRCFERRFARSAREPSRSEWPTTRVWTKKWRQENAGRNADDLMLYIQMFSYSKSLKGYGKGVITLLSQSPTVQWKYVAGLTRGARENFCSRQSAQFVSGRPRSDVKIGLFVQLFNSIWSRYWFTFQSRSQRPFSIKASRFAEEWQINANLFVNVPCTIFCLKISKQ